MGAILLCVCKWNLDTSTSSNQGPFIFHNYDNFFINERINN